MFGRLTQHYHTAQSSIRSFFYVLWFLKKRNKRCLKYINKKYTHQGRGGDSRCISSFAGQNTCQSNHSHKLQYSMHSSIWFIWAWRVWDKNKKKRKGTRRYLGDSHHYWELWNRTEQLGVNILLTAGKMWEERHAKYYRKWSDINRLATPFSICLVGRIQQML